MKTKIDLKLGLLARKKKLRYYFKQVLKKKKKPIVKTYKKFNILFLLLFYVRQKKRTKDFFLNFFLYKNFNFLFDLTTRLRSKKIRHVRLKTKKFPKTQWLFSPFRVRLLKTPKKPIFFVNVYRSLNNFFVFITDKLGKTLFLRSSGHYKFTGSRRLSMPAATMLATKALQFLLTKKRANILYIIRSSFDRYMKVIVHNMDYWSDRKTSKKMRPVSLGCMLLASTSHNGMRKPKARRV